MSKYVHLMFNDKFNKPLVDFLNKHFNPQEHLFLCKRFFEDFAFPVGSNVIEIKSLNQVNWKQSKFKKIFCHSLFDTEVVDFLYSNPEILAKAYWIMWGGDVHQFEKNEKNLLVRQNFAGYIGNGDPDDIAKKIGKRVIPQKIVFIFPVDKKILDTCNNTKRQSTVIQINNSCDKSTIEVLKWLSKFAHEDIIVKTVLSYGDTESPESIYLLGKKLFGTKFEYLDKVLSPKFYAKFLADNDILILNQNRPQGQGNIYASFYLGKKVYIRSDVANFSRMQAEGYTVYDTKAIENCTFAELIENTFSAHNSEVVKLRFDEEKIKESWEAILSL